jgi:glycosyltransferase involved in cell wall biosynthesis
MPATTPERRKLGDVAAAAGLRHMHVLAWRDLDDVEAGGSEVHAAEIASRWAAAGLDVVMRTSHAQGHLTQIQRDGYRVIRRRGRHLVFLDAPFQELCGFGGRRDGLLEVWNGLPFFAPLWARGPRATFIHHVHADMWRQVMSPGLARLGELLELRIAPPIYRRSTILTPSPSSRQQIIERLGLPADQVTAVPNGIDARFSPGGRRSAHPMVLSVGRLVPHKRLEWLIRSVHAIRPRLPDLELIVVGDGYERRPLEQLVHQLQADAFVRFEGRISDDDLVARYRSAWLVASASSDEGWGMTITEAAACATPAVATRIAGHVDVVDHGRSGLLVEGPDELTAAIEQVLVDPALRERLGAGALDRASGLTWDRTALEVLQGVAAGHRLP